MGKYLIGAGSRFLANPVIVPLLAGLLAILLFFSVASDALEDPVSGFAVALARGGRGARLTLAYAVWNRAPRLWLSLLWFFGCLLFFSTGPTWDRYLLPALPGALLARPGF